MTLQIDSLTFSFPENCRVVKWDDSSAYRKLGQAWSFPCACSQCPSRTVERKHHHTCPPSCPDKATCRVSKRNGLKAADAVVLHEGALHIVELKDFNCPKQTRTGAQDLNDNTTLEHYLVAVARKFRDTLFSLWMGSQIGTDRKDAKERAFAEACRKTASEVTFVFHFESPTVPYPSGLFPRRKAISLQTIRDRLCPYLGTHVKFLVVDMDALAVDPSILPWSVLRS